MKNVIKPLATSVLIPLGLTAPASAGMREYIKKSKDQIIVLHIMIMQY